VSGAAANCARFGKFNFVGLLGAVLQVSVLDLLVKCVHLAGIEATIIAVEIVLIHNFLWHERFTWRDRLLYGRWQRAMRFLRFHASNGLVSLTGNTILIYCLVERLKAPVPLSAVASVALCAPINYLIANYWIFSKSR
jgi:dolichol-phosphate mannosyltransferase